MKGLSWGPSHHKGDSKGEAGELESEKQVSSWKRRL